MANLLRVANRRSIVINTHVLHELLTQREIEELRASVEDCDDGIDLVPSLLLVHLAVVRLL